MREILFKAKRVDNGEWVEGSYVHRTQFYGEDCPCDDHFILSDGEFHCDYYNAHEIIPETLGQFTGLTDKNGKKIFEGDIVHCWGGEYAFGFWEHKNTFAFTDISDYMQMGELGESEFVEVIGNIHDIPELLTAERMGDNED